MLSEVLFQLLGTESVSQFLDAIIHASLSIKMLGRECFILKNK